MIFSRKIKHFMKVIEEGSYSKASESLCLTTSALRHSIYELERGVSSKLFLRCNSGIVLTDNGRCLYKSLCPIYHEVNRIYNDFMQDNSTATRIKIFMDGFYYPVVVDNLKIIQSQLCKEVVISQIEHSAHKELALGNCDIAISTVIGIPESSRHISNLFLSREAVGILVSKKALVKCKDIKTLLKNEEVLHRSELLNHPIYKYVCNRIGCYGLECNFIGMPDFSDIMETISGGNGLTMITEDFIKRRRINEGILEFIPNPFPEPIIFERHMFFHTENYHEFGKIATILKNSRL
ncbi:LysR family transcriptional regulator [Serratia quinivorans]|uniref:LysR family transcriptional regulator n=1 Tax=Serratia quinivorans TaxID=137545 RepID=UPI00210C7965|nr:LysR family transcriptional regulator [Serratia quinivorans]MBV6694750.1 LysR family transcriptional regulator [Serratia quinivorans]